MLGDHDLYLQAMEAQGAAAQDKKLAAFMGWLNQSGGGTGDGVEVVEEVVDPVDPEGSSWMDKLVDVGILLGGGAGASKGHEFAAINEAAGQRRAVEQAQEFDMAKQAAVLQQRTAENEATAAQTLALARAEAVLDQQPELRRLIINSTEYRAKEQELMDDPALNRGWLLPRNKMAIEAALAAWAAEQLKIKSAELGQFFNETTQLFDPPTTTTVTEGFGEEVTEN